MRRRPAACCPQQMHLWWCFGLRTAHCLSAPALSLQCMMWTPHALPSSMCGRVPVLQTLPIFLDRLADPITAIIISVSVVLVFGKALF